MIAAYEDRVQAAAKSIYGFYENVICLDYTDYTEAPHIKELAKKLEELCRGEFDNLCVAMPPRHSKSSMVTLAFPLWLILNDPSLNILIVNAELSLSEKFGIDLRDYLDDFSIQTGIYVSDVKHSSTHLKFEDEYGNLYKGSIKLVGASGGITGQDADYLIIDDPYKGFEDITPGLLNKKIEWFKTKIIQRREPQTKLIICHTRWNTNDLQGYLKETSPDKYEFLEFPAIKPDGTSLWSSRYSIDFLKDQMKEMGERLFSSIYQQQPLDETGDFFDINRLQFIEDTRINDFVFTGTVRSYDCAYSDESKGEVNDQTASVLMHRTVDDYYIITQLQVGRYGDRLFNVIKSTATVDSPNIPIVIETGTAGGSSKFLFDVYKKNLPGYVVEQSLPVTSKVDRAYGFKQAILDGRVLVCLTDESRGILLEQMRGFPLMKRDDVIDACSHAFNFLSKNQGGNQVMTGGQRRRWRF